MFFDLERFWYLLGAVQFSVSFVIIGMNKLIKLDVFGKSVQVPAKAERFL